jgi:uncharacterized protein YndB with AHSA1/START domain
VTGIPLRIAEETGRYLRTLRRYSSDGNHTACPVSGYHNASADIGEIGPDEAAEASGDSWPHDDARWPKTCECGYEFTADDRWQRNDRRIFRLPDGTEFALWGSFGKVAPPGTMIRATWYDKHAEQPGESWLISLPDGGEWITTQRASGGGHWEVTGTAPAITASPSIWHNQPHGWHGWVRNGELVSA